MNILLSNDDGYLAPGLQQLIADLDSQADSLLVVAPDRNRSGASNSLTLDKALTIQQKKEGVYAVDGTPSDCVYLGLTTLQIVKVDIVISGINNGANLGDDVFYSGTVAAAAEGRHLGYPSIAVSLAGRALKHFVTASWAVSRILQRMKEHPIPKDTILNVNVPDLPVPEIRGFSVTKLGVREKSEPIPDDKLNNQNNSWWFGQPGVAMETGEDTDFKAIRNGRVSVTPLHIDLTNHDLIPSLKSWLEVP